MARRPKLGRDHWEKEDWTQTADEISKRLRVSVRTVYRWADLVGATPALPPERDCVDWGKIDWTQTTAQLKEKTGVSRQRISLMRKKYRPDTIKRLV